MRPGGTRRAVVPASYGLLPEREEAFLTVRLRTIKGRNRCRSYYHQQNKKTAHYIG